MAQARGLKLYQYLGDWFLRALSQEVYQQHTQTLFVLYQDLCWVVNLTKSQLILQQVFNFVRYWFNLSQGLVKPTQERWDSLTQKNKDPIKKETCPVRQFMLMKSLLTATDKQVILGCLHMRPSQWHLKNHWHVLESMEKIIPLARSLHPHLLVAE